MYVCIYVLRMYVCMCVFVYVQIRIEVCMIQYTDLADRVVVLVGPSSIHLAESDHEPVAALRVEGPVGRVLEEKVLHQHGLGALDVQ